MKNQVCVAFTFFLFSICLQAEESPRIIELKGHSAYSDNNTGDNSSNNVTIIFSPDNKRIASRCYENGVLIIWDADTGKEMQRMQAKSGFHFIAFSPNGDRIIAPCFQETQIWDVETGKELHKLAGGIGSTQPPGVCGLQNFSPDGKKIVTTGGSPTAIRIWDVESGKELKNIQKSVNVAAFLPDGKKIITIDSFYDGKTRAVRIWDAESGKELQKIDSNEGFASASFSPDGKKFATSGGSTSSDGTTIIWDVESGEEMQKMEGWQVFFSLDGKKIVTVCPQPSSLNFRIWDVESGMELYTVFGFVISPPVAGKIFTGTRRVSNGLGDRNINTMRTLDDESGREMQMLGTSPTVYSATVSSDGKKLAIGGGNGYAAVWILK